MLCGQVIVGGVTSVTVTENEQVEERPEPSIARQVTNVAPVGKVEPLAGRMMRVTVGAGAQLSVAVGVAYVRAAEIQVVGVVLAIKFPGQVMVGACVSVVVTVITIAFEDAAVLVTQPPATVMSQVTVFPLARLLVA